MVFEALRKASGLSEEVIRGRGYRSSTDVKALRTHGFARSQCRAPGLLLPVHTVGGTTH